MPRTKLNNRNKFDGVIAVIWGELAVQGMQVSDLAKRVGIGQTTLYEPKKNPEKFSLERLCKIGKNLGIPIETLREAAIRY